MIPRTDEPEPDFPPNKTEKSEGFFKYVIASIGVICLLCFVFGMGTLAGSADERDRRDQSWQKQAIEEGYAQYDTRNGEWRWKTRDEVVDLAIIDGVVKLPEPDDEGPEFPLSQPPKKSVDSPRKH